MAIPSPIRRPADLARHRRGATRTRARRSATVGRRNWIRTLRQAPTFLRVLLVTLVVLAAALLINGLYQIVRKPTELLLPVSGALNKSPAQTWQNYATLFRRNSTSTITPPLLAALAQLEGAGNPVAHTYWRWSWSFHPFEIYRPASSSVGMYQITDGTYEQAKQYCIHDHVVQRAGSWHDVNGCWFNRLYFRVVPGDSIELTAAYLDTQVHEILQRGQRSHATLAQIDRLAAIIHLCGAGAADLYAKRGFRVARGQRCGDHDPADYLARVQRFQDMFARLDAES